MKTKLEVTPSALSNGELTSRLVSLARHESAITAVLVAHLAEFDKRHLYLLEGFSNMFEYCTVQLNMAEGAAFKRIECARILRQFPAVYDYLRDGSLHVTGLRRLGPYLTPESGSELLQQARHRTCREIDLLLAQVAPKADVPTSLRRLPSLLPEREQEPSSAAAPQQLLMPPRDEGQEASSQDATPAGVSTGWTISAPPPHRPTIHPLAPSRWRIQFTADAEMHARLREAQELLRHQIPNGDPAAVLDRALIELLAILKRRKFGAVVRPRKSRDVACGEETRASGDEPAASDGSGARSRYIPADIRHAVCGRDGARCTFVSPTGRRCAATGMLEFHHLEPFAEGGATTVENLTLRCRAHNADDGRRRFGTRRTRRRARAGELRSTRKPGPTDEPPTAGEPRPCYSFRSIGS